MSMEMQMQFKVQHVNDGLGYGEGTISSQPEGATAEDLAAVDAVIERDPRLLVPVDTDDHGLQLDDDGCGDGRGVHTVFKGMLALKRSLNRAKVFGGSVAMAVGSRIGLGKSQGKTLGETFDDAIEDLTTAEINFGAHTDEASDATVGGTNSGCGAIDKAPLVIRNVMKYKEQITTSALQLGASEEGLHEVLAEFESYDTEIADQAYSGKDVMRRIISLGKVVKRLAGGHREARIVLNTVEGYTVNQDLIRQVSGGRVQVFGVDVWRMQEIAQKLSRGDTALAQRSFISQLVYTLGVAATLTKGDLPTYLVSEAPVAVSAQA